MHLDAFTIMLGSVALILVCAAFFLFFWTQDRRSGWLAWWIAPYACAGIAMGLQMAHGLLPPMLTTGLSNALLLGGFGFLWQGARVFERREPILWPVPAVACAWLVACMLPGFLDDPARPIRVILCSAGSILFLALTYRELSSGAEDLPSRRSALTATFLVGVLFAIRIPLAFIAPYPFGGLDQDPIALAVFNFIMLILVAFFSVLMISMTKERREAEQRGFAMSDPLTGLFNRRAFADFADRLARRRTGLRNTMALLVLDLDHFKSVNDRYGHEVGDRLLRAFATALEGSTRPTDQLFRMGGEEFCVVLPDTTTAESVVIAERIRLSVEAERVETSSGMARTTVSIGIAATQYAVEIDLLLAAADAAVYEAKARGRNRVVVSEPVSLLRPGNDPEAPPEQLRARA